MAATDRHILDLLEAVSRRDVVAIREVAYAIADWERNKGHLVAARHIRDAADVATATEEWDKVALDTSGASRGKSAPPGTEEIAPGVYVVKGVESIFTTLHRRRTETVMHAAEAMMQDLIKSGDMPTPAGPVEGTILARRIEGHLTRAVAQERDAFAKVAGELARHLVSLTGEYTGRDGSYYSGLVDAYNTAATKVCGIVHPDHIEAAKKAAAAETAALGEAD